MKRAFFLLFAGLVFAVSAQTNGDAKKFKITWGGPYEIPKKYTDLGYVGNTTDGAIQLSIKYGNELVLQRFDPDKLVLTKETHIPLDVLGDGYMVDLFAELNGKYYIFYSVWNKPREKEQLFAQPIDIVKGSFAGKPQLLIEADKIEGTLMTTGFYKYDVTDKYTFSFAKDSSRVLITYRLKSAVKEDGVNKSVIGYNVFDASLRKLWSKEFKMPYAAGLMDTKDYTVDVQGNGYMLCKVYEGSRKESKNEEPNYQYQLLMGSAGASEVKPIIVKVEDKYIKDLYVQEDAAGDILCAGYYGVTPKTNRCNGVFIVKVDKSGAISKVKKGYYEFPLEVLKMFEKAGAQAKLEKKEQEAEAEESFLQLREIRAVDDGGIIINGEQYDQVINSYLSNGKWIDYTTYYYGDILSMKINENGEMAWTRKVPKSQASAKSYGYIPYSVFSHFSGQGSMSYSYYFNNGNSYFFYLDNIKNLNLAADQAPATHVDGHGGFLTVCKITADGIVSKGSLFDIREQDIRIWPADFSSLTPTTLFGRAYGDKQSKMLKLTYMP